MPSYKWLIKNELDKEDIKVKMEAMVTLGVPYTQDDIDGAQSVDDYARNANRKESYMLILILQKRMKKIKDDCERKRIRVLLKCETEK